VGGGCRRLALAVAVLVLVASTSSSLSSSSLSSSSLSSSSLSSSSLSSSSLSSSGHPRRPRHVVLVVIHAGVGDGGVGRFAGGGGVVNSYDAGAGVVTVVDDDTGRRCRCGCCGWSLSVVVGGCEELTFVQSTGLRKKNGVVVITNHVTTNANFLYISPASPLCLPFNHDDDNASTTTTHDHDHHPRRQTTRYQVRTIACSAHH